jgi:predicted transcriptional regulator of viral defense system
MSYAELVKVFGHARLIDIRSVATYFNGIDRRRLYEWQKKGYLLRLANNFYILSGKELDDQALKVIACRICAPSYIGLESALAYHRLIPEAVFQTVGITTLRNRLIRTPVGDFRFRSIRPDLFFGFNVAGSGSESFFIADPEKTLLDHFYFTPGSDRKDALVEMRFNLDEIRRVVNIPKLKGYLSLFASPKVTKAARHVMEMAHVEL